MLSEPKPNIATTWLQRKSVCWVGSLDTTVFVQEIATVKNLTYLGVNLDNKLTFEKFLNGTISRVNARLIILARIYNNLDKKTDFLIYKQTFLPILDYMCIVVNSCTQAKIKKIATSTK